MNTLLQDLRYGFRMLAKSPGVTAVAVLALALGIGSNTSIFTSVNALLLHPFPFEHLDRLVAVWETAPQQNEDHIAAAPANFRDWREQNHSFQELAAGHGWEINLTGTGAPERVDGYQVTPTFFSLLGMRAEKGRTLSAQDFEAEHTSAVVVGYGFWQQRLGTNPGVIGSRVRLNGQEHTIVGVMPEDFEYPMGVEVWGPLDLRAAEVTNRTDHYLQVMGRLRPGVSGAQGQADLQTIAGRLARQFPQTNAGHGVRAVNLVNDLLQGSRQFSLVLMGAAGFVLLLACANVANLHLARGSARRKEIAVRLALGASRGRIARQLLIESVLQSLLGAVLGVGLAYAGLEWDRGSMPAFILHHVPGLKHMHIDGYVLAFTAAVAVAAGILAGLGFAWHASRADLNEALKESARGSGSGSSSHRLRGLLVVTEVALALVLLTGAGLMVKGFHQLMNTYPGYDRRNVLAFRVALPESKYREENQVREFYRQLVERLGALPGVEAAAATSNLPGQWDWTRTAYAAEGQAAAAPGELRLAISQAVTPDVFRVLRIPLLKGRLFTAQDGPDSPRVVVLNASLAQQLWPGENPIGKRVHFGSMESVAPWCTVVGVVAKIEPQPLDTSGPPTAYFPLAQLTERSLALAVRTAGDPMDLAAVARAQVQALDPDQPVFDVRSLEKIIDDDMCGVKVSAEMMSVYAAIALVLAGSGIFALMAYSVSQRRHEIGVRMTLGAQSTDVLQLVVGRALKLTAAGLAIGVPAAWALTRALSSVLLGVIQIDAPVFAGFTLLLALTAGLAAYIPARWATKVDPIVALRYE
ncbi:MAG: ABC transporter permease [Terriglobia bacterium]|jgi:putative ABC transport system permease protein